MPSRIISRSKTRYPIILRVVVWLLIACVMVDCKAVPFFSPDQRTTRVRGRRLVRDARPRGTFLFPPFSPVPRGRTSHTSPLPRTSVVRWLVEKKGTALQSSVMAIAGSLQVRNLWRAGIPRFNPKFKKQFRSTMCVLDFSSFVVQFQIV